MRFKIYEYESESGKIKLIIAYDGRYLLMDKCGSKDTYKYIIKILRSGGGVSYEESDIKLFNAELIFDGDDYEIPWNTCINREDSDFERRKAKAIQESTESAARAMKLIENMPDRVKELMGIQIISANMHQVRMIRESIDPKKACKNATASQISPNTLNTKGGQ